MQTELILASIVGSAISYFGLIVFPSSSTKNGKKERLSLQERMENWALIIQMDKRCLIFDLFFTCGVIGVAYTIYILEAVTVKQAILGSLTAESFFYHYIYNGRNSKN